MDYRKVGESDYQVDVTNEDDLIGGIGWMLPIVLNITNHP